MPYWIYVNKEWSHMVDFHLIVFLGHPNPGLTTKIVSLGSLVPKLWDVQYLLINYANLC